MADDINSINDLVLSDCKAMQLGGGGTIPFPSYGTGYGYAPIYQSEAAWDSAIDSQYGYGTINDVAKYRQLLGDLSRNSLVMSAVRFLGDSLLEPPIQVKQKAGGLSGKKGESEIVADHKLPALWNRPNDFYDGNTLKKGIAFSLVLASNAYILKNFNEVGLWPVELWWEPHWTIRPVWPIDGSAFISHYEVNRQGQWYPIDIDNVIHIRDGIHPYNQRLGLSGNDSVLRELFGDAEAAKYYAALMGGSGVPQFMVSIEQGMKMDQSKIDQLDKMIARKTTGIHKGQPFAVKGAKAYKLGVSPKDLDIKDSRFLAEDRFCAVQGIPAVVLELGSGHEHSIYNNVNAAMERAWRGYICPKLTLIEGQLNLHLLEDFEDDNTDRYVEHDLSQIQALQEDQDKKATRLGTLFKDGIILRREARSGMNYGPSDPANKEVDEVFFVLKGGSLVKPNEEPLAQGEQIIDMLTGEIRAGAPPTQLDNSLINPNPEALIDGNQPLQLSAKPPATNGKALKGGPGSGPHAITQVNLSSLDNLEVKITDPSQLDKYKENIRTGKDIGRAIQILEAPNGQQIISDGNHLLQAYRDENVEKVPVQVLKVALQNGKLTTAKSLIAYNGVISSELNQAILDLLPDGFLNPDAGWVTFPPEMQSLNIPRTSMPQVMSNHRGAMVSFLAGRGITYTKKEILPTELKPTQAEYRPDKVEAAKDYVGIDRPLLVSRDGRVADGHHQWLANLYEPDEPITVIELNADIFPLLLELARFPSSGVKDEEDELQFWKSFELEQGLKGGPGSGPHPSVQIVENSPKAIDPLNDAEVSALWKWSGDNHLEDKEMDEVGHISPALQSAIDKLPDYQGQIVRWEGQQSYKVGDSIKISALTSFAKPDTSLDKTLGGYSKTKLIVENGLGKDMPFSHRPLEKEVLVQRGTEFKVMRIESVKLQPYGTNKEGITQQTLYLRQNKSGG